MKAWSRYAVSLVVTVLVFWLANRMQAPRCYDCFAEVGVPFHYYNEGGFGGGAHWLWLGLLGDLAVIVLAATVAAYAWGRISRKPAGPGAY